MGYDLDSFSAGAKSIFASSELAFITLSDGDDPAWRWRDCDPLQCFLPSPFSLPSSISSLLPCNPAPASSSYCLASVSFAESIKRQVSSAGAGNWNSPNWGSALGFALQGSRRLGRRRSSARNPSPGGKQLSIGLEDVRDDSPSSTSDSSSREQAQASKVEALDAVKTSKHLLAGALSACISRTIVAPLERLKLEYIVRGATADVIDVVRMILSAEGVKGFWKGNLVNLIRTAPFKSINFYAYDTIRKRITSVAGRDEVTPFEKLAAGAAAGVFATIVCFPMDTIRTRLVAQGGDALGGISGCFHHLIASQGFMSLYAGIVPAVISMAPASAVFYGVYDILKTNYLATPAGQEEQRRRRGNSGSDQMELGPLRTLLYGAIAGVCAETVTYPLEVVRRQLQIQNAANRLGLMRTVQGMVQQGGVGALYAGILPSTLQVLPSAALSYFVYEWMKVTMKVS